MSGDDETLLEIKKILAGPAEVEPEEITLSSRLSEDLGLDGDDFDEVIEAFVKRFDVDMSEYRVPLVPPSRPRRLQSLVAHLQAVVGEGA